MEDAGYSGAAFLGAAILTIWFAPAALIIALLALRGATGPGKRSQLRMWAWASAIWCAFGALLVLFAFAI